MAERIFDHPGLEIDSDELARELERGTVQLVDVREQEEWDAGRIAGAVHVPLSQLGSRTDELARDRPVVFGCRVGGRSGYAAQALREQGLDAWSLRGGLLAWDAEGRPLVPEGGVVADH
ncbi:rhodanese-like domain-containing protein [Patulibacter sp. S7RM1-6]